MRTARLALAAVCGVAMVGVGVIDVQVASAQARPRQQEGRGGEWQQEMRQPERGMARPMRGMGRITPEERRKLANHHADLTSPLDQEAAGQLQRAWHVQTEGNVTGTPLVMRVTVTGRSLRNLPSSRRWCRRCRRRLLWWS